MSTDPNVTPLRKAVPCPICKESSIREAYPFCSKRCADVDLNRWFKGHYAVPAEDVDPSESYEQ